jgi:hypothetical protein
MRMGFMIQRRIEGSTDGLALPFCNIQSGEARSPPGSDRACAEKGESGE